MDPDRFFVVPEAAVAAFRAGPGPAARKAWMERSEKHARMAELQEWIDGDGRKLAEKVAWPAFTVGKAMATRKTSQACLDAITKADLRTVAERYDLLAEFNPVIDRVEVALNRWTAFADVAEVFEGQKAKVKSTLAELAASAKN